MWDACLSCFLVDEFDKVATTYTRSLFDHTFPTMAMIFKGFIGIWAAWVCSRVAGTGDLDYRKTFHQFVVVVVVNFALGHPATVWEWGLEPLRAVMFGMAKDAIDPLGAVGASGSGFTGILQGVENQLQKVITLFNAIIKDANFYRLDIFVLALALGVPFVFLWGLFTAFVLDGAIKFALGAGSAAWGTLAAAFPLTRGSSKGILQTMMNGLFTVYFACIAMGIALTIIATVFKAFPAGPDGSIKVEAAAFIYSAEYWKMFLLGFVSIFGVLSAKQVASAVSGMIDSAATASFVVGAAMLTAGVGALAAKRAGGAIGSAAGTATAAAKPALENLGSKAQTLLNLRSGGDSS